MPLQTYADETLPHSFALEVRPPRAVAATNIIARFQPQKKRRLLLCAHGTPAPGRYDLTAEPADADPRRQRQRLRVAVLLN